MKKAILTILFLFAFISVINAQHLKKDGTPDMRYKENKILYGGYNYSTPSYDYSTPSYDYSTPSYDYSNSERNYNNGGQIYLQDGYMKSDGTYILPHLKTKPDNYEWNNLNYDYDSDD